MNGSARQFFASPRLAALVDRIAASPAGGERCELCSAPVPPDHRHLLDSSADGELLCACRPCALLFDRDGAAAGRVRAIPRERRLVEGLDLDDGDWRALGVPVGLAFFTNRTGSPDTVVVYPSPAGPTESTVEAEAWEALIRRSPVVGHLERDVEAFLVNRIGDAREYWLAPIDDCYRLVALFRTHWRGLSGGDEIWDELTAFFAGLHRGAVRIHPDGSRAATVPATVQRASSEVRP